MTENKLDSLADLSANTEMYALQEVQFNADITKTVHDFATGTERNRRWAMVINFSIVPSFDSIPPNQAPIVLPKSPSRLITADSIEDLKARALAEMDYSFEMAELSVKDPEAYKKKYMDSLYSQNKAHAPVSPEDDMN
ncbi:MAG: hypothetical protein KDH96_05350 [Candidatus Riesia sp.]|nr:hypothetical protein [Candidatus Riesia sp.]